MLHQAMIGASIIKTMNPLSHSTTIRRLSLLLLLRLLDCQGHKQDLLLVGSLTSHTHMILPVRSCAYDTSLFHLCIASSQLPPPVRFVHITCGQSMVLVAYSCSIGGCFIVIFSTFQQDSDISEAISHFYAYDLTELNQLRCS